MRGILKRNSTSQHSEEPLTTKSHRTHSQLLCPGRGGCSQLEKTQQAQSPSAGRPLPGLLTHTSVTVSVQETVLHNPPKGLAGLKHPRTDLERAHTHRAPLPAAWPPGRHGSCSSSGMKSLRRHRNLHLV